MSKKINIFQTPSGGLSGYPPDPLRVSFLPHRRGTLINRHLLLGSKCRLIKVRYLRYLEADKVVFTFRTRDMQKDFE